MKAAIINGTVLTNGCREQKNLFIEDGRITEVSNRLPADGFQAAGGEIIDARGLYVAPGFIDLHCHGGAGCDFMDGSVASVETACALHASHGTTTIFPTTCTESFDRTEKALAVLKEAHPVSTIAGVHMESFFFSPAQCGAQDRTYILTPERKYYAPLVEKYRGLIRRWSYAPELPHAAEFEADMAKEGIVLSAGHSDAEYTDLLRARKNGCKLITHLYSCTSTITRRGGFRHLGIIETALLFDDIDVELITDGCHIPPELLRLAYKVKGEDHICLVTDANSAAGTNSTVSTIGGNPCLIEDGVAKLPDRSAFAGSIATADRLVREAVKAGIPVEKAVKMITENPARIMGLTAKGSLKPGYDADLVLLTGELAVTGVFIRGQRIK